MPSEFPKMLIETKNTLSNGPCLAFVWWQCKEIPPSRSEVDPSALQQIEADRSVLPGRGGSSRRHLL